ncbi:MAG: hypothetical protein HY909_13095 [Deltaproteobacteria bacterium]|nr:hypothetical protein [Deltaproteobacteria bacterium]
MKRLLPVLLLGWSLATGCASTLSPAAGARAGNGPAGGALLRGGGSADPGGRIIGTREAAGLENLVGGGEGRSLSVGADTGSAREPHFAGPTPQIPIPVMGGGCSWK